MSGLQKTGRAIGPRPQDSGNFMIAKLALFSDCRILAKVYQRNTNPMKRNLYIDFKLQSSNTGVLMSMDFHYLHLRQNGNIVYNICRDSKLRLNHNIA